MRLHLYMQMYTESTSGILRVKHIKHGVKHTRALSRGMWGKHVGDVLILLRIALTIAEEASLKNNAIDNTHTHANTVLPGLLNLVNTSIYANTYRLPCGPNLPMYFRVTRVYCLHNTYTATQHRTVPNLWVSQIQASPSAATPRPLPFCLQLELLKLLVHEI